MSRRRGFRALLAAGALIAGWPAAAQEPGLAQLRAQAEAGNTEAQNDLGGRLIETNDPSRAAEARQWYRRASEGGSAEGMNNYATMLLLGIGGAKDEAEGRRLRTLAAERGSIAANMSIAERYLVGGEGYPRDPARAFTHMRTAAATGRQAASYAQWRVGMMYLNGTGTAADPAEAFRWIIRAADNGEVRAMISRAVMLATGEGVAENDVEARTWYERAALSRTEHFAHGLRGLGAMLLTGEGGPADPPRGIAYLRIAQAGNDANARTILDSIRDRITPEMDRQARDIADRWMREHMPAAD